MMGSKALVALVVVVAIAIGLSECNTEGDILYAWKTKLEDPKDVLQSWDPTLVNPCTWFHVTCNGENTVVRVDLGDAGLSGPLIPQLALLTNLQYLFVYNNNINGSIPKEFGNLSKLVSLGLYQNQLSGSIPPTLGKLGYLRFLTLNSNRLTGSIPTKVLELVLWGSLQTLNVSDNLLSGRIHRTNGRGLLSTTIIQDPKL